jgi:hypothetical protein
MIALMVDRSAIIASSPSLLMAHRSTMLTADKAITSAAKPFPKRRAKVSKLFGIISLQRLNTQNKNVMMTITPATMGVVNGAIAVTRLARRKFPVPVFDHLKSDTDIAAKKNSTILRMKGINEDIFMTCRFGLMSKDCVEFTIFYIFVK